MDHEGSIQDLIQRDMPSRTSYDGNVNTGSGTTPANGDGSETSDYVDWSAFDSGRDPPKKKKRPAPEHEGKPVTSTPWKPQGDWHLVVAKTLPSSGLMGMLKQWEADMGSCKGHRTATPES